MAGMWCVVFNVVKVIEWQCFFKHRFYVVHWEVNGGRRFVVVFFWLWSSRLVTELENIGFVRRGDQTITGAAVDFDVGSFSCGERERERHQHKTGKTAMR